MARSLYYLSNYIPHPGQKKLHEATEKEVLVVSSIRSGKSYAIIHDVIVSSWNNKTGHGILVTAPTYRLLEAITERPIVNKLEQLGLLKEHSFTRHQTTLKNGNTIYFRSLDDPDEAIRGLNISKAYIDEASYASKYAINIVKGRLITTNGQLILICTPNGMNNHIYTDYISTKRPDVKYIKFNLTDNPIISKEAITRLYASYDPLLAAQELEGKFINLTQHSVYHAFNPSATVGTYPETKGEQVYVGADFNLDINSWIALQRMPNNTLKVIYEGSGAKTTGDMGYQILKKFNDSVIIIPDQSGGFRLAGTAQTHFQLLRQSGIKTIIEKRKNPEINKRLAVTNAALTNALGQHRVFIDRSCISLVKELSTLSYKKGTSIIDTRGEEVGHITSAFSYAVFHLMHESVGTTEVIKKDFISDFRNRASLNSNYIM